MDAVIKKQVARRQSSFTSVSGNSVSSLKRKAVSPSSLFYANIDTNTRMLLEQRYLSITGMQNYNDKIQSAVEETANFPFTNYKMNGSAKDVKNNPSKWFRWKKETNFQL